jgi:hypothetical protein
LGAVLIHVWIGMSHLFARPLCGEHPLDAGTSGIALRSCL